MSSSQQDNFMKKFENKLADIELSFLLNLENFKKYYPLYKTTKSQEYKNYYENSERNISNIFKELFILESKLHESLKKQSKTFQQEELTNDLLSVENNIVDKNMNKIEGENGASKPIRNLMYFEKIKNQTMFFSYILGLFGMCYLFYKI